MSYRHGLYSTTVAALVVAGCAENTSFLIFDAPAPYTVAPPAAAASAPILQLDPGGHMALINDIAFTPDGRYLVSASNDKTIRVWDLHHPGQARLIRGQLGGGDEGKIYAMALSPDGRTVAVGGWMDKSTASTPCCGDIRLHDLATGQVLGLLRGHTNVVNALAFSPDGQQLVSGSADNTAIIWDVPTRRLLHRLSGHTDYIHAVAFSADGERVVTGSYDHDLRLWAASDGQLIARMTGHTDKVQAVAVATDGTIASGSWDHSIRLWDGKSGAFIKILANQGTQVGSLSFSPDGRRLLSGVSGSAPCQCHLYSVPDGKELQRYTGHDNIVLATAFSTDGRRVATAGGTSQNIDIWNPTTGKLEQRLAGGGAATWAVGISADGSRIAWGNTYDEKHINDRGPLAYQLALANPGLGTPTALAANANSSTWRRAQPTHGNWSLQHVQGGNYGYDAILEIRRRGQVQAKIERDSTDGYDHRSYTFTPDGMTIISGGMNGVLSAYNRSGEKLGNFVGHTGDVWAVAVSSDGRLLVSGSVDQTVRVWNVQSRELLLTVFNSNKDKEWVAWTPQGYYAASPNGDRMVGWQINRGPDQTPEYIEAAQLRERLYRPDILAQAVTLRSATQAIAQAPKTQFSLQQLTQTQPPKFHIVNPNDGYRTSRAQLDIELNIPPQAEPIERLDIYINGRLLAKNRLGKTSLPPQAGGISETRTLVLQAGQNFIRIVAKNSVGETARDLSVFLTAQTDTQPTGNLYLIAIGVSSYDTSRLNLQFPAADARDFQQAILQHTSGLYKKVQTRLLATDNTGEPPTANNIRDALDVFSKSTPNDTVILFVAGHGINQTDGSGYYFLPQDAQEHADGGWKSSSIIKWYDLLDALMNAKGQRILFVDTCHSGAAFNPRLLKDSGDQNILVFSASDANTSAQEIVALGHGVFTYAILEGLSGKADFMADQNITLKELDTYISNRVPVLTENLQIPVIHTPGGFKDTVFAKR
jgi:WD40 repeat protein